MGAIIDIALLAIISLCAWRGWRKGLILSVSGIVALIVAFYVSNLIADTYSREFVPGLRPFVSGLVDTSVDKVLPTGESVDFNDGDAAKLGGKVVEQMGILGETAKKLSDSIKAEGAENLTELRKTISDLITEKLAYVLVLVASFVLIVIVITVVANVINLAFQLPGLRLVNDIGGAIFGVLKGLIFAWAIAWAISFLGAFLPEDMVKGTVVLEWLITSNPIVAILG
jgi:uncharacterized membrane protein required for colicin V production